MRRRASHGLPPLKLSIRRWCECLCPCGLRTKVGKWLRRRDDCAPRKQFRRPGTLGNAPLGLSGAMMFLPTGNCRPPWAQAGDRDRDTGTRPLARHWACPYRRGRRPRGCRHRTRDRGAPGRPGRADHRRRAGTSEAPSSKASGSRLARGHTGLTIIRPRGPIYSGHASGRSMFAVPAQSVGHFFPGTGRAPRVGPRRGHPAGQPAAAAPGRELRARLEGRIPALAGRQRAAALSDAAGRGRGGGGLGQQAAWAAPNTALARPPSAEPSGPPRQCSVESPHWRHAPSQLAYSVGKIALLLRPCCDESARQRNAHPTPPFSPAGRASCSRHKARARWRSTR